MPCSMLIFYTCKHREKRSGESRGMDHDWRIKWEKDKLTEQ